MIVDEQLEQDLRAMLRRRSGDIADDGGAAWPIRGLDGSTHRRSLLAAAAAVVSITTIGIVAARSDDDGPRTIVTDTSIGAPSPTGNLPTTMVLAPDFVGSDGPLFSAPGDARAVATAYLADRVDASVTIDRAEESDETAVVTWQSESGRGTVELRWVQAQWSVFASSTDGVQIIDMTYDGARVRGRVETDGETAAAVDVVTLDGGIVPGAPYPGNPRGAAKRYGTANEGSRMDIDVPVDGVPVLLQVRTVGGTYLSISEIRLDPPG